MTIICCLLDVYLVRIAVILFIFVYCISVFNSYDCTIGFRRMHYHYLFLVLCSHYNREISTWFHDSQDTSGMTTARTVERQNRMAHELLRCKRLLNFWKWNFIWARYPCYPLFHGYTRFVRIGILQSLACRAPSIVYHYRPEPVAPAVSLKVFLAILRTLNLFHNAILLS